MGGNITNEPVTLLGLSNGSWKAKDEDGHHGYGWSPEDAQHALEIAQERNLDTYAIGRGIWPDVEGRSLADDSEGTSGDTTDDDESSDHVDDESSDDVDDESSDNDDDESSDDAD